MAAIEGDLALAKQLHFQLMPLNKALFVESNPIPVKWALHAMGLIAHGIRLPLTPLKQEMQPLIRDALHQATVVLNCLTNFSRVAL
jgi:4-hydroxy-tetrahydrodipicolinate synthase